MKEKIISYKIIPHISGCSLRKYLDKNPASYCEYLNNIIRGHSLLINMAFTIDFRDEGCLLWSIIYVVRICWIVIEALNLLLSNESLCKSFMKNSTFPRAGLIMIKNICDNNINNYVWITTLKIKCRSRGSNLFNEMSQSLIRICFNVGASNFKRLLNKSVLEALDTLKMAKYLKLNNMHVTRSNNNLEGKEMSSSKKRILNRIWNYIIWLVVSVSQFLRLDDTWWKIHRVWACHV